MRGESSGRAGGGWWSDQADGQARKACRPNTTGEHRRSAPKAVSRIVHGQAGHGSWQACHDTASDVLPATHVAACARAPQVSRRRGRVQGRRSLPSATARPGCRLRGRGT
ncbi:hypothetical protein MTO96_016016 [Rhipicephalus appendiculatus]